MTVASTRQPEPISVSQMLTLMRQLRSKAGIKIETPQRIIERNVHDRIEALGLGNPASTSTCLKTAWVRARSG